MIPIYQKKWFLERIKRMAKRLTKEEKIQIYVKNNRDQIAKKLRKNKYERLKVKYNFEEKLQSIIPCSECFVRPTCAERFNTEFSP